MDKLGLGDLVILRVGVVVRDSTVRFFKGLVSNVVACGGGGGPSKFAVNALRMGVKRR